MANRGFIIYTATEHFRVEAKTLAAAVKSAGIDERQTPILAAIQADCIPVPHADAPPFLAVLIRNTQFTEPGADR